MKGSVRWLEVNLQTVNGIRFNHYFLVKLLIPDEPALTTGKPLRASYGSCGPALLGGAFPLISAGGIQYINDSAVGQ